jgi:hypothetical protein
MLHRQNQSGKASAVKKKSNENKNELLEPNNTKGVCWRVRILSPAEAIVSRLYRLYFLLTHFSPNDDISKIFYASRDRWKVSLGTSVVNISINQ